MSGSLTFNVKISDLSSLTHFVSHAFRVRLMHLRSLALSHRQLKSHAFTARLKLHFSADEGNQKLLSPDAFHGL